MNQKMNQPEFSSLYYFFDQYKNNFSIQIIHASINRIISNNNFDIDEFVALYRDAISLIEQRLWSKDIDETSLKNYQALFHDLELLLSNKPEDDRHRFVITIPVADRPLQLEACLQSLLNLCELYTYGGFKNNKYSKINVLLSDDSQDEESIKANKDMAILFTEQGLNVEYFGAQEQKALINELGDSKSALSNIIGNDDVYCHKGASLTRNISYLKLNQMRQKDEAILFYFIDSDQEFKVSIQTDQGATDIYSINYFYYLDRIFSTTKAHIVTGKVVGDPPVSPSVMASNFLGDLNAFLSSMSELSIDQECQFHHQLEKSADDASYHDMADLFGFKASSDSFPYHCDIEGEHNHARCFDVFSSKLNQFFDGVHPTRNSYFEHEDVLANIKAARTVYTGNYIFKADALKYFIPFANIKLRMAGPVLGRIIKSELGDQFISANLPMLHKRTLSSIGQSEFRSGIEHQHDVVDLSGEFVRQFFGDVMLFSMEALTAMGYPEKDLSQASILKTINDMILDMQHKYNVKHEAIICKLDNLKLVMNAPDNWWNQHDSMQSARQNFMSFINNIEHNFGVNAAAYKKIQATDTIDHYRSLILQAVTVYSYDRKIWQTELSKKHN